MNCKLRDNDKAFNCALTALDQNYTQLFLQHF